MKSVKKKNIKNGGGFYTNSEKNSISKIERAYEALNVAVQRLQESITEKETERNNLDDKIDVLAKQIDDKTVLKEQTKKQRETLSSEIKNFTEELANMKATMNKIDTQQKVVDTQQNVTGSSEITNTEDKGFLGGMFGGGIQKKLKKSKKYNSGKLRRRN